MNHKTLTPENVRYLVIHCSATPPTMDIGRAEIDRWHRERGFFEIGYHYVIRRDGTVELGRDLTKHGAHASRFNHVSIGICMVGGVGKDKKTPEDNFTPEQYDALASVIAHLNRDYPRAVSIGHGELPGHAKACPSFDVDAFTDRRGLR